MFDHLLESSHRDDSNKWSNIGFGQEMTELASIEVNFTHLIWCSDKRVLMVELSQLQPNALCFLLKQKFSEDFI